MRTQTLISFVSAAALTGGLGVAIAGQTDMQTPSTWQQPQTTTMTGMQTGQGTSEQIASQAAMVLRRASQPTGTPSSTQAGQYGATGQGIPTEYVSAARCVVVFPSNTSATVGFNPQTGANGTAMGGRTPTATDTGGLETGQQGAALSNNNPNRLSGNMNANMNVAGNNVGVASCRDDDGNWTSTKPAFVKLSMAGSESGMAGNGTMSAGGTAMTDTGGSEMAGQGSAANAGYNQQTQSNQAEVLANNQTMTTNSNALVLLFVSDDAADDLMSGGLTLGDDADVEPGPTSVSSDNTAPAAVLAYRGTIGGGFTGAQAGGATIDFDDMANQQAYGEDVDATDLLEGDAEVNGNAGTNLTAYNQALSDFAPASQYNSKTSIAK